MHDRASLENVLEPLLTHLLSRQHRRLVAKPDMVWADRIDQTVRLECKWDRDAHNEALKHLVEPVRLTNQCTAAGAGDAIVLTRPADPNRSVEDVATDGIISALCGRMLSSALSLGRNVLVAGPWCASADLIGALLASADKPCVVATPTDAVPSVWIRTHHVGDAVACGADRIGAFSLSSQDMCALLTKASSVVAWTNACNLQRALTRYEAIVDLSGDCHTPLQVLAGIDLVVIIGRIDGPRVSEVAEICVSDDGYRPRLLFTANAGPVKHALVPVAPPSFLEEIRLAGQSVLADDLFYASAPSQMELATSDEHLPGTVPATSKQVSMPGQNVPKPEENRVFEAAPSVPSTDPSLENAQPPGWELDQINDQHANPSTVENKTIEALRSEDAMMAATFGLAPPPAPLGMSSKKSNKKSVEPGEKTNRISFEEMLRKEKAR